MEINVYVIGTYINIPMRICSRIPGGIEKWEYG